MAEIIKKLEEMNWDGEPAFIIRPDHSVNDVIQHLIKKVGYDELLYLVENINE